MNIPPLAQLAEATVLRTVKSEFESLKGDHPLYYDINWKVYGPYEREDGRSHVIVYNGKNRITVSYPRFIMECKLKRILKIEEEVHHKNELEFDNRLENLEVRERRRKAKGLCARCGKEVKNKSFVNCFNCRLIFAKNTQKWRWNNIKNPRLPRIPRKDERNPRQEE